MKMERINENQIKIEIDKEDLIERDMKITELAYGGDKAREFFRELMEIAAEECDFDVDNVPIMIEAVPLSLDSISIIVSKVTSEEQLEKSIEKVDKKAKSMEKRQSELTELIKEKIDEVEKSGKLKKEKKEKVKRENVLLYSFSNIDTIISLSKRLATYKGKSSVFKEDEKLFLLLEPLKTVDEKVLGAVLSEYGQRHVCTVNSKFYFVEHAEIIIKNKAIEVLSKC